MPDEPTGTGGGRTHRTLALLGVIALGGAVGSVARWGLAHLLPPQPGGVPWATLTANTLGCLALGALMVVVSEGSTTSPYLRPFLGTGVLGGFTTFSALALELRGLSAGGHPALAVGYLVITLGGGLAAVAAGIATARTVLARTAGER